MVDTPIFSIFHRAPPPPAPAVTEPAPTAAQPVPASPVPEPAAIPVAPAPPAPEPVVPVQTDAAPALPEPMTEPSTPPAAIEPPSHTPEPIVGADPEPAPAEAKPPSDAEQLVAAAEPEPELPIAAEPPSGEPEATVHEPEAVVHEPAAIVGEPEAVIHEPDAIEEVEYHIAAPEHGNAELQTDDEFEPEVQPAWLADTGIELPPETAAPDDLEEQVFYLAPEEPLPHEASFAEAELPALDVPPVPEAVEPELATAPWQGPTEFNGVPVEADQLGLANPIIITLLARLKDSAAIELDASQSGIYRPQRFRVAPWSGFPYDQVENGRTGLAAGTRILTSRGEMEVERLLPGDTALALRAPKLMPIAWIGRSNATVAPVLIEAGALGPDLPRRALCLAPDQAVFVEPVPVPVAQLVNGTTIRMLETSDVDLFHVDVGASEILFAEGLPLSSSDRTRVQGAR